MNEAVKLTDSSKSSSLPDTDADANEIRRSCEGGLSVLALVDDEDALSVLLVLVSNEGDLGAGGFRVLLGRCTDTELGLPSAAGLTSIQTSSSLSTSVSSSYSAPKAP